MAHKDDPEYYDKKRAEVVHKICKTIPFYIPDPEQIEENDALARAYIIQQTRLLKGIPSPPEPEEPTPAEPGTPQPAQTMPEDAKEQAEVTKEKGSMFPMRSTRPQPPSKVKEEGSVIVAKELAGQLGTSPELKAQMRIDERKMAVLDDGTLAALSHFSYRYVYDYVRYWGHITEWWLTGSQGIGGLGRRHILQAMANISGVQSVEKAKQPNVIARSLWDRNWKKNAEAEGKVVEE